MKKLSETVNKERGSHEASVIRNRRPGMYKIPNRAPYHSPSIFDTWNRNMSTRHEYATRPPYIVDTRGDLQPETVQHQAPHQVPPYHTRPRRGSFTRQRPSNRPVSPQEKTERKGPESAGLQRQELRFVLPQAQPATIPIAATIEAQEEADRLKTIISATAEDLREAEEKLEKVKKRKDAAERAHDLYTVDDITYHVIPSVETRIAHLKEQLENEKKQSAATQDPAPQLGKAQESHRPKVETETESSDQEEDE